MRSLHVRRSVEEFDPCRVEVEGTVLCRGVALAYFMSALRDEYTLTAPRCGQWHVSTYRLGRYRLSRPS